MSHEEHSDTLPSSQEELPARKDDIESIIGSFGKYQIFLLFLMVPCKIPTSVQTLGVVFLAPPVNFTCKDTFPGEFNSCPCNNPEFDDVLFDVTMITRWRLICDRSWLVSFSQTCLMLGVLIGSIVFGTLSDRYGRKFSLVVANLLELCAGVGSSFASEIWLYIALRFFIGASVGGILIVSFVLVIEFTGIEYRELVSCLLQIPFNLGYVLLPVFGYVTTSWVWLNLAYSLPALVFVFLYWVLPETPKWLLMGGKTEEAIATVLTAAKINNRSVENIRQRVLECTVVVSPEDAKKGTVLDLFKTPNMRKNMICLIVNWTISSLGFYGVSQYIGQLSGNIFINVGISAVLNVTGTVVTYLCLKFLPRRTAMISMNLVTSACLLIIAATPDTIVFLKVILACIGNLCSFTVFVIIYLYTAELFPTVVRNIAMGVTSMFSRIGAMIAPFVVLLRMTAVWIPPLIFGIAPLFAGLLCLLLPETKHRQLPNSLEESERIHLKQINLSTKASHVS